MIGIIGGSGLYDIEGVHLREVRHILTPFGIPSDGYRFVDFNGITAVFLPRHGSAHSIPPHKINYKANIWGFRELGVERIISIGASGGISPRMFPGTIVIPDQILDFTSGRDVTYYHGEVGVIHIDFTEPYCPVLRESLSAAGRKKGIPVQDSGTYVCVNGPRLETRAEINAFSVLGGDIVGMTGMPEAVLAREAEICYAGVSVVTNFAAGVSGKKLTVAEVISGMNATVPALRALLQETFSIIPAERACLCREALREGKIG
jgi:5'-methylthioadenosine phosphorylase